jgi:hypothetical protein
MCSPLRSRAVRFPSTTRRRWPLESRSVRAAPRRLHCGARVCRYEDPRCWHRSAANKRPLARSTSSTTARGTSATCCIARRCGGVDGLTHGTCIRDRRASHAAARQSPAMPAMRVCPERPDWPCIARGTQVSSQKGIVYRRRDGAAHLRTAADARRGPRKGHHPIGMNGAGAPRLTPESIRDSRSPHSVPRVMPLLHSPRDEHPWSGAAGPPLRESALSFAGGAFARRRLLHRWWWLCECRGGGIALSARSAPAGLRGGAAAAVA